MKFRYLFSLLLTAAGCFSALAQTRSVSWQTAHDGPYTYRYVSGDPIKARFYTLKNGLTVILSVNPKEPRIRALIGTRAGSNNDPADHTGLAHYLEHLLFKGTSTYGSLDWNKEKPYIDQITRLYDTYGQVSEPDARKQIYHQIDSISGIAAHFAIAGEYLKLMSAIGSQGTNAHTAAEETVYEENIPSNTLDQYLTVEAERFREPVFRLFHTELEAVYEEKNRNLDNDGIKVRTALLDGLFPHTNYGQQTTIGTVAHLKNPSLTAIRKFYNTWYAPNNMAIVLAGDLDPAQTIRKVDKAFAFMQANPLAEYQPVPELPVSTPVIKQVYGPNAESLTIGYRLPGVADQRAQLLRTAISLLLYNGQTGLIDDDLNRAQKVQSASAGGDDFRLYSTLTLSGKPKPGQTLEAVRDLLLAEVQKIKAGDFDATLIKAIVNNARLSELQATENNNYRATALMDEFIKDRGKYWPSNVDFLDAMLKLTKPEIIAFARQYLAENYVLVYKHQGPDKTLAKVEKPAITPVFINQDAQSAFLKKIKAMPQAAIRPQWIDYEKVTQKAPIGPTTLRYVRNPDNALFSLTYRIELGARQNKLLNLAAGYLQFLGTTSHQPAELTRKFYELACSYSINPGAEETTITLSGLQENLEPAARLLEDLLAYCIPDEKAFSDFRARVIKSREDAKTNKETIKSALVQYALYGPDNPFNDQLSNAGLNSLTGKDLTDLLHSLLSYRHTAEYFGPATLPAIITQIAQLHHFPANFSAAPPLRTFAKTTATTSQVFFTNYDMVQAEVNWLHNTDDYQAGRTPLIDVFNGYFNTLVGQSIRESKALAYSAFASYLLPDKQQDRYTMFAYAGTQSDKLPEAVAAMDALFDGPLTSNPALLANNIQSIRQGIAAQRIPPQQFIARYLAAQKMGISGDERQQIYETVSKISYDDLSNFKAQHLARQPYAYCIIGSAQRISEAELSKFGTVKKLSLTELFGY